ncbi:MAG: helix-turn-helix domain-containing protein, partial [Candidatus Saliniplasma sp.]
MIELINPHIAKISLALEEGDSILQLSKKIGSSYGWTHKWVNELEELDIIERKNGIRIIDKELLERFEQLGKVLIRKRLDLKDAYLLPNFSGMRYAFTKIDAVFMWTKGGYQIARSKTDYPIFIKIIEKDLSRWEDFFEGFHVQYNIKNRGGNKIYFVLYPVKDFESNWVENASVETLQNTIDWAKKYELNFK